MTQLRQSNLAEVLNVKHVKPKPRLHPKSTRRSLFKENVAPGGKSINRGQSSPPERILKPQENVCLQHLVEERNKLEKKIVQHGQETKIRTVHHLQDVTEKTMIHRHNEDSVWFPSNKTNSFMNGPVNEHSRKLDAVLQDNVLYQSRSTDCLNVKGASNKALDKQTSVQDNVLNRLWPLNDINRPILERKNQQTMGRFQDNIKNSWKLPLGRYNEETLCSDEHSVTSLLLEIGPDWIEADQSGLIEVGDDRGSRLSHHPPVQENRYNPALQDHHNKPKGNSASQYQECEETDDWNKPDRTGSDQFHPAIDVESAFLEDALSVHTEAERVRFLFCP